MGVGMDKKRAAEILKALVQGMDPQSGQALDADEVVQRKEVSQALLLAEICCRESIERDLQRARRPTKTGAAWSEAEDSDLLRDFDAGTPLNVLAERFQRSRSAISSRLMRLGRLDEMSS